MTTVVDAHLGKSLTGLVDGARHAVALVVIDADVALGWGWRVHEDEYDVR